MLQQLIISRVRVKILTLFFSHPEVMYHVREIVRQTTEEINAVRRELKHLEKAGLLAKEPRANRLYYRLRTDYPLYFELLGLIAKTTHLGGDILKNKGKLGKLKFVMMSGQFARGVPRVEGRVDLLVVGTVVIPELSVLIRTEEERRGFEINYTVMTEDEFRFRKSRKDPFIIEVLRGSRVLIVGDEEELVK